MAASRSFSAKYSLLGRQCSSQGLPVEARGESLRAQDLLPQAHLHGLLQDRSPDEKKTLRFPDVALKQPRLQATRCPQAPAQPMGGRCVFWCPPKPFLS